MARFIAAQPPGLLRKAVLIAIAAIALVMAWAAIAFSQDGGSDTYVYTKGVVKPEGFMKRTDPRGHVIVYNASMAAKAAVVTRDGKPWLTLKTAANGDVQIFDSAGSTSKPVIVIPAAQAVKGTRETR